MTLPLFRIALIGSRGAGKSVGLLSLYASLFDLKQPTATTSTDSTRVSSPWLSPVATRNLTLVKRRHSLPPRSSVPVAAAEQAEGGDVSERLTFVWHRADGDVNVEIVALAAEEMYTGGKLDGRALRDRLTAYGYDLVVVVANPFTLDARVAEQALCDLTTKGLALGYTLAEALRLASRLLFHYGPKRIDRAGIGFDELPAEVANFSRVGDVRKNRLLNVLTRDGVPPQQADEFMRVVRLLAETVACDTADFSLQRDLIEHFSNSMVALARMDLAAMTPSLHRADLTALADRILPPHRERVNTDVTPVESLDLEVQYHKTRPVFNRGLATTGGAALWNAIRARYRPGVRPAASVAKPASAWRGRVVGALRKAAQSRVVACTAAALLACGTSLGVVSGFTRAWPWVFTTVGVIATAIAFVLGRREQAAAAVNAAPSEAAAMSEPQAVRKAAPKPQELEEIVEASTSPSKRMKPSRNGHAAPCEAY